MPQEHFLCLAFLGGPCTRQCSAEAALLSYGNLRRQMYDYDDQLSLILGRRPNCLLHCCIEMYYGDSSIVQCPTQCIRTCSHSQEHANASRHLCHYDDQPIVIFGRLPNNIISKNYGSTSTRVAALLDAHLPCYCMFHATRAHFRLK